MQESIKITAVLTLVCVLCALSLSWIYGVAEERIELNAKQRIEKAIAILSPEAKEVVLGDYTDGAVYKLSDKEGKLIGYAFLAEGQGYQSTIKMLAVVDPSLKRLEGIEVIESVETPGLGAKIQEDSF